MIDCASSKADSWGSFREDGDTASFGEGHGSDSGGEAVQRAGTNHYRRVKEAVVIGAVLGKASKAGESFERTTGRYDSLSALSGGPC